MFELGLLLMAIAAAAFAHARLLRSDPAAEGAALGLGIVGLVALVLAGLVSDAGAQPLCMSTAEFERQIAQQGESEIGAAIVGPSAVVRIFAAEGGRTFTMIITTAAGRSCLLAHGHDLDVSAPPAAGERKS